MLAVELVPAVFYLGMLFFIPKSPRWLVLKNRPKEAIQVLNQLHGSKKAQIEIEAIEKNISKENNKEKGRFWDLLKPGLGKYIFILSGLRHRALN